MIIRELPVLCIIQARYHSQRLPGKMLLKLGNETLIQRAWRIATSAFPGQVVMAIPRNDVDGPLGEELKRIKADTFAWDGPEWDVLGRFHACAHTYRWHPDTVIVRYTPDDVRKDPSNLRSVAMGYRTPVEFGGEAFTLAQLDAAQAREWGAHAPFHIIQGYREHITDALFPFRLPLLRTPGYSIDTQEDYEAALKRIEGWDQ